MQYETCHVTTHTYNRYPVTAASKAQVLTAIKDFHTAMCIYINSPNPTFTACIPPGKWVTVFTRPESGFILGHGFLVCEVRRIYRWFPLLLNRDPHLRTTNNHNLFWQFVQSCKNLSATWLFCKYRNRLAIIIYYSFNYPLFNTDTLNGPLPTTKFIIIQQRKSIKSHSIQVSVLVQDATFYWSILNFHIASSHAKASWNFPGNKNAH